MKTGHDPWIRYKSGELHVFQGDNTVRSATFASQSLIVGDRARVYHSHNPKLTSLLLHQPLIHLLLNGRPQPQNFSIPKRQDLRADHPGNALLAVTPPPKIRKASPKRRPL